MTPVENFIYQFEGKQRELLLYFHNLLTEQLGLSVKIRYKIPFYDGKSWICYLNPTKNNKVEIAFVRGNELSNAQGLLDSKGRKQVYGMEFETISEIPHFAVNEVIQEAILLDETMPYRLKRKTKPG